MHDSKPKEKQIVHMNRLRRYVPRTPYPERKGETKYEMKLNDKKDKSQKNG